MGIGPATGEIERVARTIRSNGADVVEAWKHQWEIWHRFEPTPTIARCIAADHFWLTIGCWSCKKNAEIDLRKIKAEEGMTLTDVQERVRCKECRTKGKVLKLRS